MLLYMCIYMPQINMNGRLACGAWGTSLVCSSEGTNSTVGTKIDCLKSGWFLKQILIITTELVIFKL